MRDGHIRIYGKALSLAAAPTFAVMAGLTVVMENGAQPVLCGGHASSLGGMALMYALMSVFHITPWIKLGR